MRVLFLTHRLPYAPNRGDRIRAFHLLRTLAGAGHVDLVSLTHDDEEESHARDLASASVRVWTAPVSRTASLARVPFVLPTQRPLTHVMLSSARVGAIAAQLTTSSPPDVVLAYCSGMAQFAVQAPLSRYPFVLDMVDVDSEKWATMARTVHTPMRYVYAREARCLRRFERDASAKAAVTVVVNDRERDVMRAVNPSATVRTVPNGVDLDGFRPPGPPSARARVVFCGVFSYEPNEEGALWLAKDVWPRVLAARPDATLVLVGMSPTRRVRALSSDSSIEVTGAVSDVRPYLWDSSVSAAPLHLARGIQNKVLEALAAGVPCVVTPAVAEGLPLEAQPGCDVALAADAFAASIVAHLNASPSERRARAQRARLDTLGWPQRLAPMLGILEAACGRAPERI